MPALQFKPGVRVDPRTSILDHLLAVAQAACDQFDVALMVTSALDAHAAGAHPRGQAIDLRTAGLPPWLVVALYGYFLGALGPQFYIQYEVTAAMSSSDPRYAIAQVNLKASAPHLHLQWRKDLDPSLFGAPHA